MILIFKTPNRLKIKAFELSANGYGPDCRIYDLTRKNCYDNMVNRVQLYRFVIEKLINDKSNITNWRHDEVTNTLHNRLIRFFRDNNFIIYMIDLAENEYDTLFANDNLLLDLEL